MTTVQRGPTRTATPASPARDRSIDLVRAACVVVVVLLHAIMVGVTLGPAGPVFENAADDAAWFVPVTWFAQVMPLFFVIGGFAGSVAYRRSRERGHPAVDFVTGRVRRLLVPAVLVVATVGVGLAALLLSGVPTDLVATAGFRFGQPLWFLAVFLLCQSLLPAMLAAHDRSPVRAILLLVTAAIVVDAVRAVTGLDAIGMLNLAFVWLALQQLGFFLAEGRINALRARTRAGLGALAVGILILAAVTGAYSPDLLANLNPPTIMLLLLGLAQTLAFTLVRRPLTALSRRPGVSAFTEFVNARTMTIYLWHMPVLLAMAGASALLAMSGILSLPAPSSPDWWLGRPLWLGLAIALTAVTAAGLGRFERRPLPAGTPSTSRTAGSVLWGLAAVVLLLVAGTSPLTAAVATALMVWALTLSGIGGRVPRRRAQDSR